MLGIRFASVSSKEDTEATAAALATLGLTNTLTDGAIEGFSGAIFPTHDNASWAEFWAEADGMPKGVMLQLVVDDADAYAARAKSGGLDPQGPIEAHGERIYMLRLPNGIQASFQSKLPG